jgi:hypothetical protein
MAKFLGVAVQDGGSDLLRSRAATANRLQYHLLRAYAAADSYATVLTNSLGSTACVPADFVQSGASGAPRVTTFATKNITLTAASGAAPDRHVAIVDSTTSEVLVVTDDTVDTVVTAGGVYTAPAFTFTAGIAT